MSAELAAGPSGGALGDGCGVVDRAMFEEHPDIARQIVTLGRRPRAGHDRARWATVDWDAYRAQVGVSTGEGPWSVVPVESLPDGPTRWVCEAEEMPFKAGWHTALMHERRGLVMSDVPAEIAGCLVFTDAAERIPGACLFIAGLGLGIVPARLLGHGQARRIDIAEIDPDVIRLITEGAEEEGAPNGWAADQRLHVWNADALTWRLPGADGTCALHTEPCSFPRRFDACFFDIWDTVSGRNLPSMRRLHRRYGRRVGQGRMWSWERPECEAMLRRGQTLPRPWVSADGTWQSCSINLGAEAS